MLKQCSALCLNMFFLVLDTVSGCVIWVCLVVDNLLWGLCWGHVVKDVWPGASTQFSGLMDVKKHV